MVFEDLLEIGLKKQFVNSILRILTAIFTFLLFLFINIPLAIGGELAPDIQRIINRGKIVVAMYQKDVPPFFMRDKEGILFGLEVDLARNLANKLGVEIEFHRQTETYEELINIVARGEADIAVSKVIEILEYNMKVKYSEPYLTLSHAALVNRLQLAKLRLGNRPLDAFRKRGINIGVLGEVPLMELAMEDYPMAKIVPYKDFSSAALDVREGNLFAFLSDQVQVMEWFFNNQETALDIKPLIIREKTYPIVIATHWKNKYLLVWINIFLDTIKINGTLQRLKEIYLENSDWRKKLQ